MTLRGEAGPRSTVALGDATREVRAARAASGAGVVGAARRPVAPHAAVPVGRDRIDERERGDRTAGRERRDRGAARGPAGEVHRPGDAEGVEQRGGVVGPVAQAARGVDRHVLGVAEAAHVGRDQAQARRGARHEVLVEAAGREVAVKQDDGHAVGRPRLDPVHAQAFGRGGLRAHAGQQVHGCEPYGAGAAGRPARRSGDVAVRRSRRPAPCRPPPARCARARPASGSSRRARRTGSRRAA